MRLKQTAYKAALFILLAVSGLRQDWNSLLAMDQESRFLIGCVAEF